MSGVTFIDELLQDQRELTAVDQFSQWHHAEARTSQGHYQRLLPATPPGPGQQYAFEVDLDRCSGCKACVTACHSLNGLDDDESWRSVGLLLSPAEADPRRGVSPVQQHITTACHHCVDPACLNGCPVLAYDKDPVTGVVRHLDDQCIGCSYCVMKCPYEVPRFSNRLGIVRKCDMCSHRLAVGEPPACAQACPSEAIRIVVVDQSQVRGQYRGGCQETEGRESDATVINSFLPDSPPPAVTLPTTRFISERQLPDDVKSADRASLRLDPGHGPLVTMLVLTQAAAGLLLASAVAGIVGYRSHFGALNSLAGILLILGLTASVLHLGRPRKAWRAFLGWRRSWLSREIIVLTVFAFATGTTGLPVGPRWTEGWTMVAALIGIVAVFASSMVYIDTRRPAWGPMRTLGNFFGTAFLLGATLAAVMLAWLGRNGSESLAAAGWIAVVVATVTRTALFAWRRTDLRDALANVNSSVHWNARVVDELMGGSTRWQNVLFVLSTAAGLLAIAGLGGPVHVWPILAAVATTSSEFIGRYAYFASGGTKRMPGALAS